MALARKILARIARTLGVSTSTRGAYRAHAAHMTVYVSHRPHDGDYWAQLPSGERVFARTRGNLGLALLARGYIVGA